MEPAIKDKSTVVEFKLAYGLVKPFTSDFFIQWAEPKVGDVVFYVYNNHTVVKRCIATSNEMLEFSNDSGYSLKVNNKNIPLTQEQYEQFKNTTHVPEGMILAIGDNYSESVDSREYGFVSTANVLGKALWKWTVFIQKDV